MTYDAAAEQSAGKGFIPPAQIILGKTKGDYVWDLDGNRFTDFQNGWATNPLGNCHSEVLEAVHDAHQRYGYHWEHPLRFELAEQLAEIMPGKQLPRFTFEVSGTEAVESAVHTALCYKKRRIGPRVIMSGTLMATATSTFKMVGLPTLWAIVILRF